MARLHIGERVQIISAIPGFHLQEGVVASITEPFVSGESAREEALLELRLYVVRLNDGRHFRFRGKELLPRAESTGINREGGPLHSVQG